MHPITPNESGTAPASTAAIPIDDTHMDGFTATWHPNRPLTTAAITLGREVDVEEEAREVMRARV